MQVSPDGDYLAVANNKYNDAGNPKINSIYSMLAATTSEVNVYALDSLNDVDTLNITHSINAGSVQDIDYSPQGGYIYFSYDDWGIDKAARCGNDTVIVSSNAHDLRRGTDGKLYITNYNQFKQINYPDTNYIAKIDVDNINILPNFVLTGGMPIQRHNISNGSQCTNGTYTRQLTNKNYELTDHLGNVRVVINDVKELRDETDYTKGFEATPVAYYNYHSFGMLQPQRNYNAQEYKYGFGGMLKDDEITGVTGAHYTTEFRENDTRLGRWWTPDKILKPWESSYVGFANNPIYYADPFGLDPVDQKTANSGGGNIGDTYTDKNGQVFTKTDLGWTSNSVEITSNKIQTQQITKNFSYSIMNILCSDVNSERNNPYIYSNRELQRNADLMLNASLLFTGTPGLFGGLAEGLSFGLGAIAKRGLINAGIQYTANLITSHNPLTSLNKINWTGVGLSMVGSNILSSSIYSSSFNINLEEGLTSTFTGQISTNQFLTRSAIGLSFGSAGNKLSSFIKTSSFNDIVIGTYMRTSLSLGQRLGFGTSMGLYYGLKAAPAGFKVTGNILSK